MLNDIMNWNQNLRGVTKSRLLGVGLQMHLY